MICPSSDNALHGLIFKQRLGLSPGERKDQGIETTLARVTGSILYARALFKQGVPKIIALSTEIKI